MKIYALGCLQLDTLSKAAYPIKSERLWHLYAKFEDAEKCVLENRGDIFECNYNYALIEEIWVIDHSETLTEEEKKNWFPPKEWWYFADYNHGHEEYEPVIKQVDKPKCLEKIVYFWVG